MKIPALTGLIEKRILINYRVEPAVLRKLLPQPFEPKLFGNYGVAGICFFHIKHLKIKGLPLFPGIFAQNVSHRIAVTWLENGIPKEGLFIPRRDTSSPIISFAGGKFFPGLYKLSRFKTRESNGYYELHLSNRDRTQLSFLAKETTDFSNGSVFPDIYAASEIFAKPSPEYAPRFENMIFDGVVFQTHHHKVRPIHISQMRSSFFEDEEVFPKGSAFFDHALLMKNIRSEWIALPELLAPKPSRYLAPAITRPLSDDREGKLRSGF
ncbi:MAG: DUF2071 domain-containing protein [Bacteroidia bacterium]|nr:DUF2071 domain-containing protein [Bacteroidia bacterium]